jgi:3-isopropylmalate dehydrogenase
VGIGEPVHGSAPDIAGKGIANPTAAILSAALLVRYYWKMPEHAEHIETAVRNTLDEGAYTSDITTNGALNTEEFTARVCKKLQVGV